MEWPASWKILTLVFYDFLKNIVQDRLWIILVGNAGADAENVSALFYVVLQVVVRALVRELRHFDLFGGKLLVEVVEV